MSSSVMIKKYRGMEPTPLENLVVGHLMDINEFAKKNSMFSLDRLYIKAVKEVNVNGRSIALVIFPRKFMRRFRKIQVSLIAELEKRLADKQVVMIAQRIIASSLPHKKPRVKNYKMPYSHTRAAMFESVLADLLHPADVAGKRISFKTDGSVTYKILMSPKDRQLIEGRTETYQIIYKKLTGRDIVFEYLSLN